MKINYINLSSERRGNYTTRYMQYIINNAGLDICTDANIILATVNDVTALSRLRRLRNDNPDSKIVCGGFEGYTGDWMLAYADYVVAGKGARFIKELGKRREIPSGLPEVYSCASSLIRATIPYEDDDLNDYCLVRVGIKHLYAVGGFGCKAKCAFCKTSWVQPYRKISSSRADIFSKRAEKAGCQLTLIMNDYDFFDVSGSVRAQSMRVRDFLDKAEAQTFIARNKRNLDSMLHFGIEGISERARAAIGKPISNDDIRSVLRLCGRWRQQIQLFFILGLPNDNEIGALAEIIEPCIDAMPRVFCKFTPLNPAPHTPFWTMNLRNIPEVLPQEIKSFFDNVVLKTSRRFRMFPVMFAARSLWRTLVQRASWDEIEILGNRPKTHMLANEYLDAVCSRGLEHLVDVSKLGDRPLANSHIVTPYRQALLVAAHKWNLPTPNLREFAQ